MLPKSQLERTYNYEIKKNYYFKRTDTLHTGLQTIPINIKNQLLFKDLQLMLQNEHIPVVMWSDQIEGQIKEKIIEIQQKVKGEFSLRDLYFSDVQQQKLEILDLRPVKQDKNQVLNELKIFGNKIRQMNNLLVGQYGKHTLESLLKLAISFYTKIRVKKFYSEEVQEEQIKLRYLIEQILMNPNNSQNETEKMPFLCYQMEDDISKIITYYSCQLKNVPNIKIGCFLQTQVFGKNINQIIYQQDFFKKLKETNKSDYFAEKVVQLLSDFSGFKQWAIVWTIEKHLNSNQTIFHPLLAIRVLELLDQYQCLNEYTNLKDEDIFKFLLELSDKITGKLSESNEVDKNYEENEMKKSIKSVIDIIRQKRNITDIDIENLDQNVLIEKLYKEQCRALTQNVTLIGYLDFTRDLQSFQIIENYYLNYILSYYGNEFQKFFSDQTISRISDQALSSYKLYIQEETQRMQEQGESFIQPAINIFNKGKFYLGQSNKNNQDLQYDLCLQEFPGNLKIYFSNSFKKKQVQTKIQTFVEQQSQQFKKQLDWYKQYLKQYTQEVFQKLSNDFNNHVFLKMLLKLTDQWILTFELKLLNLFIPFINMQEFIKTKQFTNLCSEEVSLQQKKYDYLNQKFQVYQQFIQASLNQYKQVKQINPDKEGDLKFENNLVEQYMWKILESELDQSQTNKQCIIQKLEKDEINFQIKEQMNRSITESIQSKIQSMKQKKGELFEQYQKEFDYYYLPFQCLENQIRQIIWHQTEKEQEIYFQKLKDFSQRIGIKVEKKCKNYERSSNFGFTDKTKQELQTWIKELIIEEFNEFKIEEESFSQFVNWIGQKIEQFYGYSEEQINKNIEQKQDPFLNQYLNEIYDLTKQQCEEILIPEIPLVEFKIDKLQDYRPQFIKIVEESQNQQDLERRTFQYFQHHALSFVLEDYQNQIEKKLKEVNDPQIQ